MGAISQVASQNAAEGVPASLRITNIARPLRQLVRSSKAILLENASYDTTEPIAGLIPEHLRAKADSGAYLVQSRAPPDDSFRHLLHITGAEIISYIPNNAYLVRASAAVIQQISGDSQVQAVMAYEPYYKLQPPLLSLAVGQRPLPAGSALNVLFFSDARAAAADDIRNLGLEIIAEEPSPFGPVATIRMTRADSGTLLPALASISGVQSLELARSRVFATDLTRSRTGVAVNSTTPNNYLGLTGTNVLVNINDSGVDASHPDLTNRVNSDLPGGRVDTNGHGTHVAGIIAGDGCKSLTVTNASGSIMPAAPGQFRGMAPAAKLFVMSADPEHGPASDTYLQQTAARTNAFISNNSWHYANDNVYDLAAARYDAAVRDALPGVSGSQPLIFVFGAGNAGNGGDDGFGGDPDSIQSPGTAKNVITVGAIDQMRLITNEVYQCSTNGCVTNAPWFGMTHTNNEVSSFSSRGNVGVGVEGDFGRFKPDVVAPGAFLISARSSQWNQAAYYQPTNLMGNYFEVLSNLNNTVGPYYRYESGTSMSAAGVSGALALMQEFFQRRGRTNSPALMKALLINGARGLGSGYDFQINAGTNAQGWGLINLTNSLPVSLTNLDGAAGATLVCDQSPTEALMTGQSRTRVISVAPAATNQPLRITLVWTDPPGNPAAGMKLVNNLDLVVTNLESGEVFFGNDFYPASPFSRSWDTNNPPNLDVVNNVENVYLGSPLGASYSVTVVARGVNVNAVTAQTNGIAQDYALVISSGDGAISNALSLSVNSMSSSNAPVVLNLTNAFTSTPGVSGAMLMNQRVGANSLISNGSVLWPGGTNGIITPGQTNQWRFYVITNDQNYTNAAFVTFSPVSLAIAQDGLSGTNLVSTMAPPVDIDLYVSTNPALLSLDLSALAGADKSLRRGGTEMVIYTNALPGIYYVGAKAESQQAAEFAFMGVFSLAPFGLQDSNGVWTLRGINVPAEIPDGSAARPGLTNVIAIAPAPVSVRRVVVTNEVWHESFSDLTSTLTHGRKSVVLSSRALPPGDPTPYQYTYIYEDNGEGDIVGSTNTMGPGSLRNFVGDQGQGVWLLTMRDDVFTHTGLVENLVIRLDPQNVMAAAPRDVMTNAFSFDFVDVPIGTTNLTVCVSDVSDTPLPLGLYLRRADFPSLTNFDQSLAVTQAGGCLSVDLTSLPPLNPGRYFIGIFNSNTVVQSVLLNATIQTGSTNGFDAIYSSASSTPIIADAVTNATLFVTNHQTIAAVEVGLHVDDPRISDMVFTLVSPSGTRILLSDNRGGLSTNGLGGFPLVTNVYPERSSGDFNASTNVLDLIQNQGLLMIDYEFFAVPDTMHVYYDNSLIFDSGSVSNSGHFDIPFGPGASTNLSIVMNEGNNEDTNTLWDYIASVVSPTSGSVIFTENTNLAQVPVKFSPPPFVAGSSNALMFCLPEQSLNALAGEGAFGQWRLEMRDTRAVTNGAAPILTSWQLRFVFQSTVPIPIILSPGNAGSNSIPPGEIAYFAVDPPVWAGFASNFLYSASGPVNLLFNQTNLPTGTNAGDVVLLAGSIGETSTVASAGSPSFIPGTRYYLGVENTNAYPVTAALGVTFDVIVVTTLTNGVSYDTSNPGPVNAIDYYRYTVSSNAVRAEFEIDNPSDDVTLVARQGLPVPDLTHYQFISSNPGTNEELIVIFKSSSPVPLTPGDWYISAINVSGVPISYSIRASEYPVYGTNFLITDYQFSTNSLCLTWSSLPGIHYYVQGKPDLNATNWTTVSPTIVAADVSANWCVPLPSSLRFFRVHEGLAVAPSLPQVRIASLWCLTNGMALQWHAATNAQFTVQYTPSLAPPTWTDFTNPITGTNGSFSFFDDGSQCGGLSGPRYYRLRLLQP